MSDHRFRVTVNGTPAPQGSKRIVQGRLIDASKALAPWREAVRHETQQALQQGAPTLPEGPVRLDVWFTLTRPKSHLNARGAVRPSAPRFPAVTPDLDKLTRAICDALVAGGALGDDKQVVSLHAFKVYGPTPSAQITLTSLDRKEPQ